MPVLKRESRGLLVAGQERQRQVDASHRAQQRRYQQDGRPSCKEHLVQEHCKPWWLIPRSVLQPQLANQSELSRITLNAKELLKCNNSWEAFNASLLRLGFEGY